MPGECKGIQGNTGKCQGNVWEWVQSARGMLGMQGDAKGTYGSGCKLPGECSECRGMPRERMGVGVNCQGIAGNAVECRGMQGMQGNARGTFGSGCIVPEKCRGLPGECKGVGVKC